MADHSKPTLTSKYANFVAELDGRLDDLARGLDPVKTSATNLVVDAIRWSSAGNKWEKWNGSAWFDLSAAFAIPIVGGSVDNSPIGSVTPSTGSFTVLTEAGKAAVTQADIGTDPNKIPLNGMLGDMAYQSKDGVRINGGIFQGQVRRRSPVTKTSSFTVADAEHWIICNGAATITVTLPDAASNTGREIMLKTIAAYAVVSASSNVVPLSSSTAGAAILAATAGKWATLVSDGNNWVITQGN